MMWQVTPLSPEQGGKYCGFTGDDQSLLVSMEDGRFFNIEFNNMGEMQGQDLLTGERLMMDDDEEASSTEFRKLHENSTEL